MLKSVVKQGLILLVIALAVMIAYVIHHNHKAKATARANRIIASESTDVFDVQINHQAILNRLTAPPDPNWQPPHPPFGPNWFEVWQKSRGKSR